MSTYPISFAPAPSGMQIANEPDQVMENAARRRALNVNTQGQQLENQQRQQALTDQNATTQAMLHDWDGKNIDDLPSLILKRGGSANAVFGMQKQILERKTQLQTLNKDQLDNLSKQHDATIGALNALDDVPDEQLGGSLHSTAHDLIQQGLLDPQHAQTIDALSQLPPDQARQHLKIIKKGLQSESAQLNDTAKRAEANASDAKASLDAAQEEAAHYKEDPTAGLIDLRTGQPVNRSSLAPLGAAEAQILGKKSGDLVPLKLKNTANEMVNRGIHITSANGRQLMVDGQGNTVKDLGTAPAVTTFNLQNSNAAADNAGNPSAIAQAIAENRMKWSEAVSPRTPQGVKNAIMAQVFKLNPNYDTAEFGLEADSAKKARSGAWADTRLAYNTAIDHSQQLLDTIDALNNGDVKKLSSLKNFFKTEFGSPDVPTFQAVANAYNHEVTTVVSKGHITDAEVATGHATLPDNASPQALRGVVGAYNKLMNSKRDELDKIIKASSGNKANSVLNINSNGADNGNDFFSKFGGKARAQ